MNLLGFEALEHFERVGICVHDAGAANQIFALLKCTFVKELRVFASGPALGIFTQSYGEDVFSESVSTLVDWAEFVLVGTGWMSNVEKQGISLAIQKCKICVAYFDHWTNYSSRLTLNGEKLEPSAIWVSDREAKILAVKHHPNVPVVQIPNFYLQYGAAEIKPVTNNNSVLYVCEPIFRHGAISLELTLEPIYFALSQIDLGHLGHISKFILRPHPSQKETNFLPILDKQAIYHIEISKEKTLTADISRSYAVVGYHSFALVIAEAAKRKIFCSAPIGRPKSELRLSNMKYLRDFHK